MILKLSFDIVKSSDAEILNYSDLNMSTNKLTQKSIKLSSIIFFNMFSLETPITYYFIHIFLSIFKAD